MRGVSAWRNWSTKENNLFTHLYSPAAKIFLFPKRERDTWKRKRDKFFSIITPSFLRTSLLKFQHPDSMGSVNSLLTDQLGNSRGRRTVNAINALGHLSRAHGVGRIVAGAFVKHAFRPIGKAKKIRRWDRNALTPRIFPQRRAVGDWCVRQTA